MEFYDEDTTDQGAIKAEHDRDQAKLSQWRPSAGDHFIRILPVAGSRPGEKKVYWEEFARHYEFKALTKNPNNPFSVLCLDKSAGVECYACKHSAAISKSAMMPDGKINEELRKFGWQTSANPRFVMNVLIVREDNKLLETAIKTWEVSNKTHVMIRGLFSTWFPRSLASPTDGYVLKVTVVQQGRGKQIQSVQITPYCGPLPLVDWHTMRPDLKKYVQQELVSPEQMRAYFDDTPPGFATALPIAPPLAGTGGTTIDPMVAKALGLPVGGMPPATPAAAAPAVAVPVAATPPAAPPVPVPPSAPAPNPLEQDPVYQELLKKATAAGGDPKAFAAELTKMLSRASETASA